MCLKLDPALVCVCVWDGVCRCRLWFCEVNVCLAVCQELVEGDLVHSEILCSAAVGGPLIHSLFRNRTHVRTHARTHARTDTHTHGHAHTRTHRHRHTHTHTHTRTQFSRVMLIGPQLQSSIYSLLIFFITSSLACPDLALFSSTLISSFFLFLLLVFSFVFSFFICLSSLLFSCVI